MLAEFLSSKTLALRTGDVYLGFNYTLEGDEKCTVCVGIESLGFDGDISDLVNLLSADTLKQRNNWTGIYSLSSPL
jgi:hypothetical protein